MTITLSGYWCDRKCFEEDSIIYKYLKEFAESKGETLEFVDFYHQDVKSVDVVICSFFGMNIEKILEKCKIKIFVIGECLDIQTFVNTYCNNIPWDICVSFQPSKEYEINKHKLYNIQCQLPCLYTTRFSDLNKIFNNTYYNKKKTIKDNHETSFVVSNSGRNHWLNDNKRICSDLFENTIPIMEQRINLFKYLENKYGSDICKAGGACCNNIQPSYQRVKDKISFCENSLFNICFENVVHPYYMTEKIFDAYKAGCIPIYAGDPHITEVFNPNTFINCLDIKENDGKVEYRIKDYEWICNEMEKFINKYKDNIINKPEIHIFNNDNWFENARNKFKKELFKKLELIYIK